MSLQTNNAFVDLSTSSAIVNIIDEDTVTIGWQSISYTSSETGTVTVCAEIIEGVIARSITVSYSTIEVTAQSKLQIVTKIFLVSQIYVY